VETGRSILAMLLYIPFKLEGCMQWDRLALHVLSLDSGKGKVKVGHDELS